MVQRQWLVSHAKAPVTNGQALMNRPGQQIGTVAHAIGASDATQPTLLTRTKNRTDLFSQSPLREINLPPLGLLLQLPQQMPVPSRLNEIGQMPNRSVGCPEAICDFIKDDRGHDDSMVVRCLRPGDGLMQTLHLVTSHGRIQHTPGDPDLHDTGDGVSADIH